MRCPYNDGGDCSECWRRICPAAAQEEVSRGAHRRYARSDSDADDVDFAVEEIAGILCDDYADRLR